MEVVVQRLTEYSDDLAAELGLLRPDLSVNRDAAPVEAEMLQEIIASNYHDQLVAEHRGRIVGTATMSLHLGALAGGRRSWLEDFVVASDEEIRGKGVGHILFRDGVLDWSKVQRARELWFTSRRSRDAAHEFYKRQGATISETSPFVLLVED
jgi:GNAT superfamily N-acetyltransferase